MRKLEALFPLEIQLTTWSFAGEKWSAVRSCNVKPVGPNDNSSNLYGRNNRTSIGRCEQT